MASFARAFKFGVVCCRLLGRGAFYPDVFPTTLFDLSSKVVSMIARLSAPTSHIFRPNAVNAIGAAAQAMPAYWRRVARIRRSLPNARSDSLQPGQAAPQRTPACHEPRSKNR